MKTSTLKNQYEHSSQGCKAAPELAADWIESIDGRTAKAKAKPPTKKQEALKLATDQARGRLEDINDEIQCCVDSGRLVVLGEAYADGLNRLSLLLQEDER